MSHTVRNLIAGEWVATSGEAQAVRNPATDAVVATVGTADAGEVDRAVQAAHAAFEGWRRTPPLERARHLFRLRDLLIAHKESIATVLTAEHGKTIREARLEIDRAVDNVEVACGITRMMQGDILEDAARGIDEYAIRQPLGVYAALTPFNFPAMIAFWFMPYALAAGNCYVVKPSPRVPMTMGRVFELLVEAGFPPGVVSLVNGGRETAEALMDHPLVRGISFVGSTAVARQVYARSAGQGKRVQAQAGAKNFVLLMPDADLARATENVVSSAFDCTGQRCLAVSVALVTDPVYEEARDRLAAAARALRVGDGMDPQTDMGPIISREALARVRAGVDEAVSEGAAPVVDGRGIRVAGYPNGYWVGPTLLDGCHPAMRAAREEIFGPVLCLIRVKDMDEALAIIDASPYGNSSAIYTQSGRHAREFRYRVRAGNVGINIGVAAPMAYFHFGGMKESFFGDLHAQAQDAVQFFTEAKVIIERW
ncbi:MAG: CoA-acylating methylmalonate-semialdehyde dehydrogenase [Armatimonadetes bacterium]|nr:CoA-acylating methylmalonate-semialdehyde dehydrogenase [Armatimonadota bacterium]